MKCFDGKNNRDVHVWEAVTGFDPLPVSSSLPLDACMHAVLFMKEMDDVDYICVDVLLEFG
jgi:hypothetical protein